MGTGTGQVPGYSAMNPAGRCKIGRWRAILHREPIPGKRGWNMTYSPLDRQCLPKSQPTREIVVRRIRSVWSTSNELRVLRVVEQLYRSKQCRLRSEAHRTTLGLELLRVT